MKTMKNTTNQRANVLIVEDSRSLAILYQEYLRKENVKTTVVETGREALSIIEKKPPKVIILDLHLPDMNGMDILNHVVSQKLAIAVVVVTGHGSVNIAVDAMQAGAFDFIEKPFSPERFIITLHNALEHQRLSALVDDYRDNARDNFHSFIGASTAMRGVYHIIESAAPSKATVFITGESGTGKELCAEAIHADSDRQNKPFIAINCAAIPKDLMESEIFGHIKGAFTGAHNSREGAATQADGGTLFLDEICDMDLDLQTKLLRFIQTGTFQAVGSNTLKKVDIRFICATNRNPLIEVEAGRFREDLYYRLHVIPIILPPLSQRDKDVLMIARQFLHDYNQEENKNFLDFSRETEQIFLNYTWPGNVRQLQNIIRNTVVLHNGELIEASMLPSPLDYANQRHLLAKTENATMTQKHSLFNLEDTTEIRPLAEVEKCVIERAISLCDGNIPKAAIHLGISASTIYRKKQTWENHAE